VARLEPVPAGANLGFLYATDALADRLGEVFAALRERTGVSHWVGSVGMGVCATGVEYYDRAALAVMVGALPGDAFRVFAGLSSGFEAFESAHRSWCEAASPYFGVVHGDPRNGATARLLAELSERLGGGFFVGGLASSRGRQAQLADAVTEGGLSGVLFGREIAVTTRLTQGCSPIGPRREITRAEGNLVFEIDGRPALDVLKEDIGEVLARDLRRIAGYIFAGLPVRGTDTGDYLVRNLIGVDPAERVLAIGDYVAPGVPLVFCRRDAASAREDLLRMLAELRAALPERPRAGLYCSCIGRGINLFGANSEELGIVERELGDFPLVGFYANGEICHNRLYGYTGVLTVFT